MAIEFGMLELFYRHPDSAEVLEGYIQSIANRGLLRYKRVVYPGGEAGESVWTHIMNVVTVIEKVRPLFHLSAEEMRCLLLAISMLDLNKVVRDQNDGDIAVEERMQAELEMVGADRFFPLWREYLFDITYLVYAHHEGSMGEEAVHQRLLARCLLDRERLEGPLKCLVKVADVTDEVCSGGDVEGSEEQVQDTLLEYVNAALSADGQARRYRFIGHRLDELRGLMTNIVHREMVAYLQEVYGEEGCIDLLYRPEGVSYLFDRQISLRWTHHTLSDVVGRVGQRFEQMRFERLEQFIQETPGGIRVDEAALQSGAPVDVIFGMIADRVEGKQYPGHWRKQLNFMIQDELDAGFGGGLTYELMERIEEFGLSGSVIPKDEAVLKRGEFLLAYRNFLEDHYAAQLKAIEHEAWRHVVWIFRLPKEQEALYGLIDPSRRGYLMALDLPVQAIEEMKGVVLRDLDQLEKRAREVLTEGEEFQEHERAQNAAEEEVWELCGDITYLEDYLDHHLELWTSTNEQADDEQVNDVCPVQAINVGERQPGYAEPEWPHARCGYCGRDLEGMEYWAADSARDAGGQGIAERQEAEYVNECKVCRAQFLLEKLVWGSVGGKQGKEAVTFYLHFFPYAFYTQPLLQAWWKSMERVREGGDTVLLFDTRNHFRLWEERQGEGLPRYYRMSTEGMEIPRQPEALGNTPVLQLVVSGDSYGLQLFKAVERAALIAHWFDSRVVLSHQPAPSLNLADEYMEEEPVVLLLEDVPYMMSWLLPEAAMTRQGVDILCLKLSKLHQLADKLALKDEMLEETIYDLVVAASNDPLKLHDEVDRLIAQNVAKVEGEKPEYHVMSLGVAVAPLLKELTRL